MKQITYQYSQKIQKQTLFVSSGDYLRVDVASDAQIFCIFSSATLLQGCSYDVRLCLGTYSSHNADTFFPVLIL